MLYRLLSIIKAWAYLLHRCSHWWLLGEKRLRPSAEFVVCRAEQENRMSGRDGGQNSGWVRQLRGDSQEHVRDVCRIQSVDNGTLLSTEVSATDWFTLDNRTHDCCTEHCVVYTVRSRDISAQFVWLHNAFCVRENCSCDVAISHARSVYAVRGSRPVSDEEHIRIAASFCAFQKFGIEKLV